MRASNLFRQLEGRRYRVHLVFLSTVLKKDLLQFDYIYIAGVNVEKYTLMPREDHSKYALIFATCDTSAEQAETAIIDWCEAFGPPQ